MTYVITLPNGRAVSLGVYAHSWRTLKAVSPETPIRGFSAWPTPAGEVLRELRWGLHDRINRHIKGYGAGRKWSSDWQRTVSHCAQRVNTPRLVVRWVPAEFRARLAGRVFSED